MSPVLGSSHRSAVKAGGNWPSLIVRTLCSGGYLPRGTSVKNDMRLLRQNNPRGAGQGVLAMSSKIHHFHMIRPSSWNTQWRDIRISHWGGSGPLMQNPMNSQSDSKMNPNTPVIVGVGDIVNRSLDPNDADSPTALILKAVERAWADASPDKAQDASKHRGSDLSSVLGDRISEAVTSLTLVPSWTHHTSPQHVARLLGLSPSAISRATAVPHGGNGPALAIDQAARAISQERERGCIIAGAEALASLAACTRANKAPRGSGWNYPEAQEAATSESSSKSSAKGNMKESILTAIFSEKNKEKDTRIEGSERQAGEDCDVDLGENHSVGLPIHVYPIFENGFRAARGQTRQENDRESRMLYSTFEKIARASPYAWGVKDSIWTEEKERGPTDWGREICSPYPLLMNAQNSVNMACAVFICSASTAEALRVPRHKWIFVLAGAGYQEPEQFWKRQDFKSCPAMSSALDTAMSNAGVGSAAELDLIDIYSCFPIVPKLAAHHLGLPLDTPDHARRLTVLGGLTFFGGAGNNYSMHVVSEVVRQLRAPKNALPSPTALNRPGIGSGANSDSDRPRKALVLANGGVLTHQHAIILCNKPRDGEIVHPLDAPLECKSEHLTPKIFTGRVEERGAPQLGRVESFTVEYDRAGIAERVIILGRLIQQGSPSTMPGSVSRYNPEHLTSPRFMALDGNEHTLSAFAAASCSGSAYRGTDPIGWHGLVRDDPEGPGRYRFELISAPENKL